MLMRIAKHNKMREKFSDRYEEVFRDYGHDLAYIKISKCYEKDKKLYKKSKKDNSLYKVAARPQRDDFGLYEYVNQHCGYCEDDFYGTVYTKTPFKNRWLECSYHC